MHPFLLLAELELERNRALAAAQAAASGRYGENVLSPEDQAAVDSATGPPVGVDSPGPESAATSRPSSAASSVADPRGAVSELSSLASADMNQAGLNFPRQPDAASTTSLASVSMAQAGRGFRSAVDDVKSAVARVARARQIDIPAPVSVPKAAPTRWTNADQRRVNKQNQDTLDALRKQQQIARAERRARRARASAVSPAPPETEIQAALENANDVAARAVQARRTSGVDPRIETLNEELAFYLAWLTKQEEETSFVPARLAAQPPRAGRRTHRRRRVRQGHQARNSTFRRHRKH
jgi:hypothetical protein